MAAKKQSRYDYNEDAQDAPVAEVQEAPVMPVVPEGADDAIFRQGWLAGCRVAAGAPPKENAFTADTPQAEWWQMGYDAGVATPHTRAADGIEDS